MPHMLIPAHLPTPAARNSRTDVDRAFRTLWSSNWLGDLSTGTSAANFAPAVDAFADDEDLVARFDLPGVDPDNDVSVEVQGQRLVVSGERKDVRDDEQHGHRFREVRFGGFRRAVALPQAVDADADAVTATYDAGVLTVRVTGAYAGSTPSRIEITKAA